MNKGCGCFALAIVLIIGFTIIFGWGQPDQNWNKWTPVTTFVNGMNIYPITIVVPAGSDQYGDVHKYAFGCYILPFQRFQVQSYAWGEKQYIFTSVCDGWVNSDILSNSRKIWTQQ